MISLLTSEAFTNGLHLFRRHARGAPKTLDLCCFGSSFNIRGGADDGGNNASDNSHSAGALSGFLDQVRQASSETRHDFREQVRHMGIREVLSAPRSPWQRAYVE